MMKEEHVIKKPKAKKHGFFLFSLTVFIVGIAIYGAFLLLKISSITQTVFSTNDASRNTSTLRTLSDIASKADESTLRGHSTGRINILLLGIAGDESGKQGALLTDTIMIASVDTQTHRVSLMSLPRDLLVETTSGLNKINAFYGIGIRNNRGPEDVIKAVEQVTDQEIHYHVVMDFVGFVRIVDALGGINIDVPRAIDDPLYPGPGYSYEPFTIEKGFHNMDGTLALKYVRTRHDDPESDFGRARRQQSVLRALRNKALSIGTLANPFKIIDLLEILEDHITTNITTKEIRSFSSLVKKVDTQNITTVVVDAWKVGSLLRSTKVTTPVGTIAGLTPRSGDWDEITEYADEIFSLEKITLRRDAIVAESPRVVLLNASSKKIISARIKTLLTDIGFPHIETQSLSLQQAENLGAASSIIDRTDGTKLVSLSEISQRITSNHTQKLPKELSQLIENLDQKGFAAHNNKKEDDDKMSNHVDFVIILGEDLIKQHAYEEASREIVEKEHRPLPPK